VQKVILYDSYSKGTAGEYSDIDVAVVVDKVDGDLLESKAKLFNLTHDIDVSIEPILLLIRWINITNNMARMPNYHATFVTR
jgi:predicted nucleotidyltransferase